jgi:hypothetical protein
MPPSYRNHLPAPRWENTDTHVCARCTPNHPDLRASQTLRQFDRIRPPFINYVTFLLEVRGWSFDDAVSTALMRQKSVRRQEREEDRLRLEALESEVDDQGQPIFQANDRAMRRRLREMLRDL